VQAIADQETADVGDHKYKSYETFGEDVPHWLIISREEKI
jgi:hypothetical protein